MTDGVDNQNVEPPSPPTPPPPPPKPEPIEPEALHEQVTGVAPQTRSVDSSTEPAATESMQFEQPLEVEGETYPPGSTATAHEALPAVVVASSDSD